MTNECMANLTAREIWSGCTPVLFQKVSQISYTDLDWPLPYQEESLSIYLLYTGCANTQMPFCRPFRPPQTVPYRDMTSNNSKGNTQQSSQSNQQPVSVNPSSSHPGTTLQIVDNDDCTTPSVPRYPQCERTQPQYLHPMVSH